MARADPCHIGALQSHRRRIPPAIQKCWRRPLAHVSQSRITAHNVLGHFPEPVKSPSAPTSICLQGQTLPCLAWAPSWLELVRNSSSLVSGHFIQTVVREKSFLKPFFLKPLARQFFSRRRSHRCDENRVFFVQIGAILASIRPFEVFRAV